ncbi:MAG: sigma-70 family RNA polymerase sigma factor [Saprospiraceae bacterium]|nr:sigma-70 family RNA polymerase sigma factor [Bacteroidia bacterium]NNE14869.1 sigma-70 family RNA polymerase sigma factor [Saprospiraceae bacterium]NNL90816.1 sigma-70 family RNA polymerase sigma factor [Saprospiraceae bacterium]
MNTDNQLIQQVLDGHQKAFGELVKRYQNKMYSVCLSILKKPDEAQEATQDTFIKMHRSLDKYNAEAKFSSWLYKIAYRTSLDYLRKRKSTVDIEVVDYASSHQENGTEAAINNAELTSQLQKALTYLKPDEAGLVRMFYLKELSIKELEEVTGMSKSNIKVKLFRARKKLSEIISQHFSEIENYLSI